MQCDTNSEIVDVKNLSFHDLCGGGEKLNILIQTFSNEKVLKFSPMFGISTQN